jgi:PPP family 3-phenylpropionic acid transporter
VLFKLAAFYFFYFAAVGVYIIYLPKVLHNLEYTTAQIGIIFSIAALMRFLTPFMFLKKFELNSRLFNTALLTTIVTVALSYFTIEAFSLYMFTTLFYGVSLSLVLPYVETIAIAKVDRAIYGKVRLFGSIGFMVVALLLAQYLEGYVILIHTLLAVTLLTALFGYLITHYDETSISNQEQAPFSITPLWRLWLSLFLIQLSFGAFYNFFTIYETEHGISLEVTSYLWSFGVIAEIFMLYFQGSILKRFELIDLIIFSTLLTVIRWLLVFLYSDNLAVLFFSQALHAFSFALYHTSVIMYLYTLYSQKKLAQQFFLGVAYGLGGFSGALIAGAIYGEFLFLSSSLFALIAYLLIRQHKKVNYQTI